MLFEVSQALKSEGFEIERFIDTGNFGRVYTVKWNQYPDDTYIAKVMPHTARELSAYQAEVSSLTCLSHPNIINMYKHIESRHTLILILEYCPNGNAVDYIKKCGCISNENFPHVAFQCINALYQCHLSGIAHLDVKPSNFLVGNNSSFKLGDFGLSTRYQFGEQIALKKGSAVFLPPERCSSQPYDPMANDVWALGVTFYYFVAGKLPFDGETSAECKKCIKTYEPKFPSRVSPEIKELIQIMLTKDPSKRPSLTDLMLLPLFLRSEPKDQKVATPCKRTYIRNQGSLVLNMPLVDSWNVNMKKKSSSIRSFTTFTTNRMSM